MEKRHNPKRPKNQIPWLIIFPNDNKSNSCTLFNPEEKYKLYKTQDLGDEEYAKSDCIATYESWLLMQDSKYNLNILNSFTRERINLPPVESQLGMTKIERTIDDQFLIPTDHNGSEYYGRGMDKRSPVFWIDEKTKDYVVIWGLGIWCVVYSTKGDTSWNQIPEISGRLHMVYKDHRLYFSSYKNIFAVLDFSREIPQQTFQCSMLRFNFKLFGSRLLSNSWCVAKTKLVVRVTGDVLLVERMLRPRSRIQSFCIYKVYSSSRFFKDYAKVDSLGDEAMLLDLGITVPANEVEGLNRNYIYFSGVVIERRQIRSLSLI